jgi:hypothetical protein
VIKRLAWYSTEFGLVIEDNRFKVFGAGIISGRAELANAIMEFYRLSRDNVFDYTANVFEQLTDQFLAHREDVHRLIDGVNELHRQGQMSSQDQGWNVVHSLYNSLGVNRDDYFGEVILAPFDETSPAFPRPCVQPHLLCRNRSNRWMRCLIPVEANRSSNVEIHEECKRDPPFSVMGGIVDATPCCRYIMLHYDSFSPA